MEDLLDIALRKGWRYKIKYVDYEDHCWTAPVVLTPERLERIRTDKSISKVIIEAEINID